MFHDINERCFWKKTRETVFLLDKASAWKHEQQMSLLLKTCHQSQLDWETFWPNLQLLSLPLLNVMLWWAARRPGYFSHLEFFKSDVNSLGFKTSLIFTLSLYDLSEPQTSGWGDLHSYKVMVQSHRKWGGTSWRWWSQGLWIVGYRKRNRAFL